MKKLLTLMTIFVSYQSMACQVHPDYWVKAQNNLVVYAANEYGANILDDEIELNNYKHDIKWTYSERAYKCHDTDYVSGEVTLNYNNAFNHLQKCKAVVQVSMVTEPKNEQDRNPNTVYSLVEISKECGF